MEIIYIPCRWKKDIKIDTKNLKKIEERKVGIVSTIQFLDKLDSLEKILETRGVISKRCGYILGCDLTNALKIAEDVEAFIYVGDGKFHAIGLALETNKKVYILDPKSGKIFRVTDEELNKIKKRRRAKLLKAALGKRFGILISSKSGQFNLEKALEIKNILEEKFKEKKLKAFLFIGEEIKPENLLGFEVDVWINTACPRLVDDYFDKPIINAEEFIEILEIFKLIQKKC